MSQIHQCQDRSDTINLYPVLGLFLKPIARINVTVNFPTLKQAISSGSGKSVSSWEVMERVKGLVSPENFISLKVVKNTLEFIRFEGDLENRGILKSIIARLEGKTLKLTGFRDPLKIRAAECKIQFPSKYDWDSFFRDAKHMNEMKAGERPDTIHFQCLPCKWFSEKKGVDKPMPSEKLFRRVWETFGDVRCVDIPVLDPYRQQMQSNIAGIKTFTFSQDPVFEAYVQYKDYLSFVRAMDSLRGCYLLFQEDNKSWVACIKVDFDKSKHLSDHSILQRRLERERLIEEEKRRERQSAKILHSKTSAAEKQSSNDDEATKEEQKRIEYKIALEERMYVIARRKLESVRLLDYLFDRVKKTRLKARKDAGETVASVSPHALSPSFYNVERSPRIEKCRRKDVGKLSDRDRSRSESPEATNSNVGKGRPRSSDKVHASGSKRDKSPSPRRRDSEYHRSARDFRDEDYKGARRRNTSHQRSISPARRSRSRSYSPHRGRRASRSGSRDRSPSDKRRDQRSFSSSPRRRNDYVSRSQNFHQYPKRDNGRYYNRYLNDWELRPNEQKREYNEFQGRGNFRGRRRPFNRGYPNHYPSYERYNPDPVTLKEAYEEAYTKYFRSITRSTSDSERRKDSPPRDTF